MRKAFCKARSLPWICLAVLVGVQHLLLAQPLLRQGAAEAQRTPVAPQQSTPAGFNVDVANREQVRIFYNAVFQAAERVPLGWTGNIAQGDPGTTSREHQQAVVLRVNAFRALAGVPSNIALNDEYSRKAQQAALLMSANNALTHYPPSNWMFYTEEAAEAARNSNLSLGSSGAQAVLAQVRDDGENNSLVGHRRWILFPPARQMGTGDVSGDDEHPSANCLWVLDNSFGTRPATREEFVAWPPPGFIPYPLVFRRWSFSYPKADFSAARVTMTRGLADLPVSLESVTDGYGDNTLVWSSSADLNGGGGSGLGDSMTHVTIENVVINGAPRQFDYNVVAFDPAQPGPDAVVPTVTGPVSLTPGPNLFQVQPTPLSAVYQYRLARRSPVGAAEGAENGLVDFDVSISPGYEPVAHDIRSAGQASFHLASPSFRDQFLTWQRPVLAGSSARLSFRSRLGWATENQAAEVQVSTDEGVTWLTVYRQVGQTSPGEGNFVSRSIDLAQYAGRTLHVRFGYLLKEGGAYNQTDGGVGWYLDEISWSDAEAFSPVRIGDVPPDLKFFITPTEIGDFFVQVRPLVFGNYFLEWSPTLGVSAAEAVVPPRFAEVRRLSAGGLELVVQTAAGKTLKVESSPDLRSWVLFGRFPGTGGALVLSDPAGITGPRRFYRAANE